MKNRHPMIRTRQRAFRHHAVGTFPNEANPNTITEQDVSISYTLDPVATDVATALGGPRGATGFVLNGIEMDPGTGG